MTELNENDAEIRHALRQRLRWEQAVLGRAADLPAADRAWSWALELEVLQRLDEAIASGNAGRLHRLRPIALRILRLGRRAAPP